MDIEDESGQNEAAKDKKKIKKLMKVRLQHSQSPGGSGKNSVNTHSNHSGKKGSLRSSSPVSGASKGKMSSQVSSKGLHKRLTMRSSEDGDSKPKSQALRRSSTLFGS